MLRTALLALCCAFALSPALAQDTATPGTAPAARPQSAAPSPETAMSPAVRARLLWRRTMAKKPAPKPGCFSTTFPSTEWKEMPCSTAALRPHAPGLAHDPKKEGHGNDPIASPSAPIFSATGTLAKVSGVTSESDPTGAGVWSLQLNTNKFNSALCGGQADCKGWEQFIVDNPGDVYIQYWLLRHTNPCPPNPPGFSDTWHYFAGDPHGHGAPGCVINGNQTAVPKQGLGGLQGFRVTGTSSATAQSTIFETADGKLFTSSDAGDLLSMGSNWTQAEFNILGYGDSSEITFNPGVGGASIVVRIDVNYPGDAPPACPVGGVTEESNNLNVILPCAGYPGQPGLSYPGVQFTEDFFNAIPGCLYSDPVTAVCTPIMGSNFSDATFTASCGAGVTMQQMNGGVWQALPQHCSDGKLPGSCGPGATVANEYVLGTQRYGRVWSGAPIGSSQSVGVCDNASHCSRFNLTIPECPSVVAPGDSLTLSEGNNPIDVEAGGSIEANLILDGPWVSFDHGAGAQGWTFDMGSLPPGMTVSLSPGVSGAPHTYGTMSVLVNAPPNAPLGDYHFQVKATDVVSNVSLTTVVPVKILACKPTNSCSASVLHFCGPVSDGCGGSVDCGACATGVCSNSVCCPAGWFFNTSINSCQPNSCPNGTTYCVAMAACATEQACNQASPPVCRKINGKIVCE